jgi:hypothetical protein
MHRWIVLLVWVPFAVQAGDSLNQATRLLQDMEYKKARNVANRVLDSARSGPEDLTAAYRIRGLSLSALGKTDAALEDFKRLLAIDPEHKLSADISPKLAAPFYQAVAMNKNAKPLRLIYTAPRSPKAIASQKLKVRLEANPYQMANSIRLCWWTFRHPKERKLSLPAKRGPDFSFKLPGKIEGAEVFFFFEAVNKHGGVLTRAGSKKAPLHIRLAPEESKAVAVAPVADEKSPTYVAKRTLEPQPEAKANPVDTGDSVLRENEDDSVSPWYTTWWFWTAVGVVAAAGVTTGTVLALQSGGDTGPVNYGIRFR